MPDRPLSPEQFIALNDEMAAIARIGIPLEVGLRDLSAELPGQLQTVTGQLQQRLAEGQPLEVALRDACLAFPPAYQAVVLAGLKAGRLSRALESVAESTRHVVELRRIMRTALVYPALIVIAAYALFVVFTVYWAPVLVEFYEQLTFSSLPLLQTLTSIGQSAQRWAPCAPLVVAVPVVWWFLRARKRAQHPTGSMRHYAGLATFAELLAAMVEQRVPLDEALPLAAAAVDNRRLQEACRLWAEQIQQGQPISVAASARGVVPEWLAWLLQHADDQPDLARNIAASAQLYRREVRRQAVWYAQSFPLLATALIGGTATLVAALLILGPWFYLLYRISTI